MYFPPPPPLFFFFFFPPPPLFRLLHPASSFRLCGMSGLPPDHESYARAALAAYGRDRDTPLRLLSPS